MVVQGRRYEVLTGVGGGGGDGFRLMGRIQVSENQPLPKFRFPLGFRLL